MTVPASVFAEQLAWLRDQGIPVLRLRSVVGGLRNGTSYKSPAVVLTADDGHRSVYTEMYPLLLKYQVPATLFIYPSAISNATYALTWEELSEMARSGLVDVQSHTYWHPNFHTERERRSARDYDELVTVQLVKSKRRIETKLGNTVDLLAWPFGIHDEELERRAAQAGYVAAFTLVREHVPVKPSLLALPRYTITNLDRGARFSSLILGIQGTSS